MMFVYVCLRVGIICRKMVSTFLYMLRTLPVYNTGTCSGGPRSECFRHTRYRDFSIIGSSSSSTRFFSLQTSAADFARGVEFLSFPLEAESEF